MDKVDLETVKQFAAEYIISHPKASSRDIADSVYIETGIRASHVTIQGVLHDLGYVSKRWAKEAGG